MILSGSPSWGPTSCKKRPCHLNERGSPPVTSRGGHLVVLTSLATHSSTAPHRAEADGAEAQQAKDADEVWSEARRSGLEHGAGAPMGPLHSDACCELETAARSRCERCRRHGTHAPPANADAPACWSHRAEATLQPIEKELDRPVR